jgi:5-formyltetrahydrofolate cyclo-ligase
MPDAAEPIAAAKSDWRSRLLAARRARDPEQLDQARRALRARVLDRVLASGWRAVAAYEPLRTEPGSSELLAELSDSGVRVLVPVLLPDRDLDWAVWSPSGERAPLGREAIATVAAAFVPALAVARDGTRLGRGGGSYDRALARTAAPACALIFDDEFVPELPRDAWDRPVRAAVTPTAWIELPRPPGVSGMPGWP